MVCKKCNGFGYIQQDSGYLGIPQAIQCSCMVDKALSSQAERAWKNLSIVPARKNSSLNGKCTTNLRIESEIDLFKLHLRSSLYNFSNPNFFVKVVGDHQLMSAWLGGFQLQGQDIADPDYQRDLKVFSVEDLAESADLLVVRLGTKRARNSAMSEVLIETIEMRIHANKPTWLVCEPSKRLEEGHLAWSKTLEELIYKWDKIEILSAIQSTGNSHNNIIRNNLPKGKHKRVKL